MPRQVDHNARRRIIAEAVCALVDERGFEGIRLRDVADRAGVSTGAVQRCFVDKNEMLLFAVHHVGEQIMARIAAKPTQDGDLLTHAAEQVALLETRDRAQARVWLAFVAQAAVTPALASQIGAAYGALEDLFTRLIIDSAPDEADARLRARTLIALIDGLTMHTLIGRLDPPAALAILRGHLHSDAGIGG